MTPPSIIIMGPFPPPMHGAAAVTDAIANALSRHAAVRRCDISPGRLARGITYHLRRVWQVLAAMAAIVRYSGSADTIYISAAGGAGLVYNLRLAAVARSLRRRLVIHHHSFAYLDRRTAVMAYLVRVAGARALHLVLCSRMGALLRERYPAARRTLVVSNAAFFPPVAGSARGATGLRLGHMSNLTDEKGLDLVFDLYREASASGIVGGLVLAGPPADAAACRLVASARDIYGEGFDYRGPVYGDDKERFFADIDVFVFPTRYMNEAEPLVVFEAMARGIPVIAYGRGCIAEQLGDSGAGIPIGRDFVQAAREILHPWAATPDVFAAAAAATRARMAQLHAEGKTQLEAFMAMVAGRERW